ncbi:MAG TPA: EAL domain-containing response regulator [Thermoanaerobaculia bacterium]|nr:EAL domain-containing response regulator [Thermoanaerobaculia bacterium]
MDQIVLVVDDDKRIAFGLGSGLEEPGRRVIVCNDVESADLILEELPVTHVLTDIKFGGAFGFEGLQVIDLVRRKVPTASIIAMSGEATPALREEAKARGAEELLRKPFSLDDLSALIPPPDGNGEGELTFVPTIDDIVGTGDLLTTYFQPIVWTERPDEIVGFEALSRLKSASPLAHPELLFRYGASKKRLPDLELAAAKSALRNGRELTRTGFLSINVHPELFAHGDRLCDELLDCAADVDISPSRLVVEITEQGPLPAVETVAAVCATLRAAGARIGFDDIGSAYSHLRAIAVAHPSYLKISQHFGTSCENNPTNRKIVENIESLARSFSCEVVLEGIETAATAAFARDMGIRFGQGFFYGAPADAETQLARLR